MNGLGKKMSTSEMDQKRGFDIEYMQKTLQDGFKYIEEARNREIVLVLGNSGVGKSTTCNYLAGHPLKMGMYKRRPIIDTLYETDIKIGHEVKSETLYAKTISCLDIFSNGQDNNICLLDCPGFFGNTTVEDRVVESISTELAVRNSSRIKGAIILISFHSLLETRVQELYDLVQMLISLFKNPIEMIRNLVFVVTKKPRSMTDDDAKNVTMGTMESLVSHCKELCSQCKKGSTDLADDLKYIECDRIATFFSVVLKEKNIIFINPLDSGESKRLIFDQICNMNPRKVVVEAKEIEPNTTAVCDSTEINTDSEAITIDDFNFHQYDQCRVAFNRALYQLADSGCKLMGEISQQFKDIESCIFEIAICEETLENLHEQKFAIEDSLCNNTKDKRERSKAILDSIERVKLILQKDEQILRYKNNKLSEVIITKTELLDCLRSMDSDDPILFVSKCINIDVAWWKIFGYEEMNFRADTQDPNVPIVHVSKTCRNGTWKKEEDRRSIGVYKIKYASDYLARPAYARVETYIKTKDEPGNKLNIASFKEEINIHSRNQKKLEIDIADLEANSGKLRNYIEEAKNNVNEYEISLEQELKKCADDIVQCTWEIMKKKESVQQSKILGSENLKVFDINKKKYDIIVYINSLFEFPSMLISHFVEKYSTFSAYVVKYQSDFIEEKIINTDASLMKEKTEEVHSLIGEAIKSSNTALDGNCVNENSPLQQLDADNSDDD